MHWIDIIILLILAIAIGLGFWRGFIHETLSLLSWVAAFIVARLFAPDVAQWLQQHIDSNALMMLDGDQNESSGNDMSNSFLTHSVCIWAGWECCAIRINLSL